MVKGFRERVFSGKQASFVLVQASKPLRRWGLYAGGTGMTYNAVHA